MRLISIPHLTRYHDTFGSQLAFNTGWFSRQTLKVNIL